MVGVDALARAMGPVGVEVVEVVEVVGVVGVVEVAGIGRDSTVSCKPCA